MTAADRLNGLIERYHEAGQIEELLRDCAMPAAADLVAARLGGMRDALARAGVDIEEHELVQEGSDAPEESSADAPSGQPPRRGRSWTPEQRAAAAERMRKLAPHRLRGNRAEPAAP
jgi:hypothetical protein